MCGWNLDHENLICKNLGFEQNSANVKYLLLKNFRLYGTYVILPATDHLADLLSS